MRRDWLPILVVLTALLAVGLVGAALVVPSSADDAAPYDDRTITVDATGSADADSARGVAFPAVLAAVPPGLSGRRLPS